MYLLVFFNIFLFGNGILGILESEDVNKKLTVTSLYPHLQRQGLRNNADHPEQTQWKICSIIIDWSPISQSIEITIIDFNRISSAFLNKASFSNIWT